MGKAPRKIVEEMYGVEVFYEEAVNIILPGAYEAAVKEQAWTMWVTPRGGAGVLRQGRVVTFKATVAVRIPRSSWASTRAWRRLRRRSRSWPRMSTHRLKEMAERNSRLVSVERAVKKGDTADIDFEGFDNGVAFDGGKGENFDLEIGSGSFVPGLRTSSWA